MNASATLDRAPPTRHAPLALWRVAEVFMHMLSSLFGNPEDVAAEHTLTAAAHKLLASWLRCAEAMLRRLLLIEASAYAGQSQPVRRSAQREGARVHKLIGFDADKPEAWRVSFLCFQALRVSSPARGGSVIGAANDEGGAAPQMSDAFALHRPLSHASRDSSPARGGAKRFYSAWPLAERYEAILRAFNNPARHARRLAAQLHARPQRIRALLHAPPEAPHRCDQWEALTHSAERHGTAAFNSS